MTEAKRRRFFLILICGLIVFAVAATGLVLFLEREGKGQENPHGNGEASIPSGQLLVDDFYEGERLIPKFDLPQNRYDLNKFHDRKNGVITYGDLDATLGVDVSEYQGDIDWGQAKDAGIEFALLRLGYRGQTQGLLHIDEKFEQNMENASAAGLPLGVYFFSQAITEAEAEAEAEFVLETLGDRQLSYPVIFDWEVPIPTEKTSVETLRAYQCTGGQVTAMAEAFCRRIKEGGRTPAVYFNKTMAYEFLDLEQLKEYDFWYAEYQKRPSLYYDFTMWQYTETGTIPGIGTVDLNIAFKAYS